MPSLLQQQPYTQNITKNSAVDGEPRFKKIPKWFQKKLIFLETHTKSFRWQICATPNITRKPNSAPGPAMPGLLRRAPRNCAQLFALMHNSILAWEGVLKHVLSQAYKFRNNEANKELRPFTPQCKCNFHLISKIHAFPIIDNKKNV